MSSYRLVLFDIEGTTTSISFVYDVLFPYARRELADYIETNWDDPEVLEAARLMAACSCPEAATARARALMDGDVKDTGLKLLQGRIWKAGYESGELRGHIYPDVVPALEALKARGIDAAIYSSGSVKAQKLLFGFSEAGDLLPYFRAHFDTITGQKKDAASYTKIASALQLPPQEVLFVSDNPDELKAAVEAGMQVRLAVRPGNPPVAADLPYEAVSDFRTL